MTHKQPLVYISILNWNGIDETIECLESLQNLDYDNYRIVVIDNASKENQGDRIKDAFPQIHLIKNDRNEWFARGHNQGIKHALRNNAKYVLLLNNDTVVNKNFLKILVSFMEANENVGVCGPVIKYYKSDKVWFGGAKSSVLGLLRQSWKNKSYSMFLKTAKEYEEVAFITGCALLARSSVVRKIGMLDPIYYAYVEDVDFCYRCRESGYKVVLVNESVIDHKKSAAAGEKGSKKFLALQTFLIGRNDVIFARKNLKGISKYKYIFGLFTIKFLYFMIYGKDLRARFEHIRGLLDGFFKNLESKEKWYAPERLFK